MRWLRGLLLGDTTIIFSTIFFGILSYIASFFDRAGVYQAHLAYIWAKSLVAGSGLRVKVEGLEQIDPTANYIFVSNHTSYMDTPVILAYIRSQFRFLAKSGLFKIPLLGGHLHRAGHISVPLDDARGSVKTMQKAAEVIHQQKISLLIFPEGGRTEDGVLQPFKDGAAYIAIRAGVPVVPMILIGVRDALPFGAGVVLPGAVTLRVLKPIETTHLTIKDRGALTNQLRELISNELRAESETVSTLAG
jgi:1-acyl-sn-glycerol-3-phosphate acyltransferase